MIDTGSMVSTMSDKFYQSLKEKPELKTLNDFNLDLKAANGSSIPYLGYVECDINTDFIKGNGLTIPMLVVPSTGFNEQVPVLIGTNLIRECAYQCPNSDEDEMSIGWKTAIEMIKSNSFGVVKTTKTVILQPMETVTITGFVRKSISVDSAITEPLEDKAPNSINVCPRVVTLNNIGSTAKVPVRLCNISAKIMKIPARTNICKLQQVNVLRSVQIGEEDTFTSVNINQQSAPEKEPVDKENKHTTTSENENNLPAGTSEREDKTFGIDLENTELSNEDKEKVYNLFDKWSTIFPTSKTDLGHTTEVKHKIELTDEKPFKEPYRRVPPALYEEIKEHLREMLEIGAIRESKSPWSSNVVIVRKVDGSIRFCIDFRKLNNRTKKDAYGIPKIEDTLHMLSGSKYFSKLDLKAGYWQVEMEEKDKEKTAFQVGGGLGFYECNRMPFGLCNAPATFQRLMERCMGQLNLRDCLIYLDDIIIYSADIATHIERLDKVFERLAEYNLKVKPSKCEFFQTKTTYLGHVVSEAGIQADPAKIEAVRNWPCPNSIKQVRQFLGFAGYYRRFIKGFASIARPLNDLLIGHPTKKQKTINKTKTAKKTLSNGKQNSNWHLTN